MPRLINADVLFKMVERSRNVNTHEKDEFRRAHDYEHSHFLHLITEQPTIDAVPVVRRRECIHSDDGWFCDSPFHGGRTFPGDYCNNGERREDRLYESLKRGLEEAIAYENGEIECRTETREEGDVQ